MTDTFDTSEAAAAAGGRRYHFGFGVEYEIGHVTFARVMRTAVAADPSVCSEWYLLRSLPDTRMRPILGRANYTVQMSARMRLAIARDRRPLDAVMIHTQTAAMGCWSLMRRLPIVISTDATPRNIDELAAAYIHRQGSHREEEAKRLLVGSVLRRATKVVPWAEWTQKSLIDDYGLSPEQVEVVRPGIILEEWPMPLRREPGPCRLLFVGGDFNRKGGRELLDCLGSIPDDWELDIVTRSNVAATGRIRVHRGLQQGDPALLKLYQQADIFAFPSLGDAVPWVLLEAMATGCAIVSTSVGAIPEMVPPHVGVVVPPADPGALRAALAGLVADPARCAAMGTAGRRRAEQDHDGHRQARRIVDIMKQAAHRHSSLVPSLYRQ